MARKRVAIRDLAQEAGLEMDEALIVLWDAGFGYVNGPGDTLPRGESNRARRALGLATRRELASEQYWATALGEADIPSLLASLGVPRAFEGGSLTKRAIHRLKAETRRRGLAQLNTGGREVALEQPTIAPFEWKSIGHEREMRYLSADEITAIHQALVEDFWADRDPILPPGVKSQSLLESAVGRQKTSLDETPKYPTVEMTGAALFHALVHNHPFHNGNKRTALVSLLVFLDENGFTMTCTQDALFKLVLQLAQHVLVEGPRTELADREVLAVAQWISENSRWLEQGERPLAWRRLRRILTAFSCRLETPGTSGNRINISRELPIPGSFLRKAKTKVFRTQTAYAGEGREADANTIKKVRHDLELDDDHGVDSRAFYDNDQMSPSDFILKYRKTLKRLARL